MVSDRQVRKLMKLIGSGETLAGAAMKAGMDEKTARRYRDLGRLPSEVAVEHTWRTRADPFADIWEEVRSKLEVNPGLEAKTLFEDLQRRYPGRFPDGQLRTLQRRVKIWRALEGPPKEVFFDQRHRPGELCQSDFTAMTSLGVRIGGELFRHQLYHFVLPYSNWETGMICFSESFESLSEGLQNALWELGGVPKAHRTDRLSTAVHKMDHPEKFTARYRGLLRHYDLEGRRIQAGKAHENGDVEQSHYRLKKALDQSLRLRGSRDFATRQDYERFLGKLFAQLNANRQGRLKEELAVLRGLPPRRLDSFKRLWVRVGRGSRIRVNHNVYSVDSRLIAERVEIRLHMEHVEVWYAQRCVERMPRLRGEGKHRIEYRHIIDWLVRKPGAFENYRYRDALFPTHRFRMAYDQLRRSHGSRASKAYLSILELAAKQSESGVDEALSVLLDREQVVSFEVVKEQLRCRGAGRQPVEVRIPPVDLSIYDTLLATQGVRAC